jgi:cullin 1
LTFYTREWNRFTTAAKYISHQFGFFNRNHIRRELAEGKKNIYDVYTLHLVRWKQDFFMHVKESVMASVLVLVEKQRNGETVDTSQIKSVVDSLVSLGTAAEYDSTKSTLEVYRDYFEKPFLSATAAYYRAKFEQPGSVNNAAEYRKKVNYGSTLPDNKPC